MNATYFHSDVSACLPPEYCSVFSSSPFLSIPLIFLSLSSSLHILADSFSFFHFCFTLYFCQHPTCPRIALIAPPFSLPKPLSVFYTLPQPFLTSSTHRLNDLMMCLCLHLPTCIFTTIFTISLFIYCHVLHIAESPNNFLFAFFYFFFWLWQLCLPPRKNVLTYVLLLHLGPIARQECQLNQ